MSAGGEEGSNRLSQQSPCLYAFARRGDISVLGEYRVKSRLHLAEEIFWAAIPLSRGPGRTVAFPSPDGHVPGLELGLRMDGVSAEPLFTRQPWGTVLQGCHGAVPQL